MCAICAPHGKVFPADSSWVGSSHLVISEIEGLSVLGFIVSNEFCRIAFITGMGLQLFAFGLFSVGGTSSCLLCTVKRQTVALCHLWDVVAKATGKG